MQLALIVILSVDPSVNPEGEAANVKDSLTEDGFPVQDVHPWSNSGGSQSFAGPLNAMASLVQPPSAAPTPVAPLTTTPPTGL